MNNLLSHTVPLTDSPAIEYFFLSPEMPGFEPDEKCFQFLFLLEGRVEVADNIQRFTLKKGEFFLLSRQTPWKVTPLYQSSLFVFSFKDFPDASDKYFFRSLSPLSPQEEKDRGPYKVNPGLDAFLRLLYHYKQDGVPFDSIAEVKLKQLFVLLRQYYTTTELRLLLHPLICNSFDFFRIIMDNRHQVQCVSDMIRLCKMSRSSFERRFRREFGCSANQWILNRKAEAVCKSLADPNQSLEQIRYYHGFNSSTHFSRFCRSRLGTSPTQIRKKLLGAEYDSQEESDKQ